MLYCLLIIVGLEKSLDIKHGLPNVLTEPTRILQVAQRGSHERDRGSTEGLAKWLKDAMHFVLLQ